MYNALAESWLINHRVQLRLVAGLSQEALECTLSTRGGRTVGQQLAHVYEVRRSKIETADKSLARGLPKIEREDGHDRKLLERGFRLSGEAIAELVRQSEGSDGKVKGFRRGIAALITYFVAHDAHHRGHILLTIKQNGIRRPAEIQMGLWDWNKI